MILKGPITNPIKTKINIVNKIVTKVKKNMKSKLIKIGYCSDALNKIYFYKFAVFRSPKNATSFRGWCVTTR